MHTKKMSNTNGGKKKIQEKKQTTLEKRTQILHRHNRTNTVICYRHTVEPECCQRTEKLGCGQDCVPPYQLAVSSFIQFDVFVWFDHFHIAPIFQ